LIAEALLASRRRPGFVPEASPAVPWVSSAPSAPALPSQGPTIEPLARGTQVFVKFQSIPPGAEIRRVGEPELLGTTPAELSFPSAPDKVEFELNLAGFEPWRYTLALLNDATVVASLQRVHPAATRRQTRPPPPSREGTLDPFSPLATPR
jgi:hypothetical protein